MREILGNGEMEMGVKMDIEVERQCHRNCSKVEMHTKVRGYCFVDFNKIRSRLAELVDFNSSELLRKARDSIST